MSPLSPRQRQKATRGPQEIRLRWPPIPQPMPHLMQHRVRRPRRRVPHPIRHRTPSKSGAEADEAKSGGAAEQVAEGAALSDVPGKQSREQEGNSVAQVSEPAGVHADGPRYRWGIALNGGLEKVSVVSGPMGGLDLRLGVQINDLLAVYLNSYLGYGQLSTNGNSGINVSGVTGTVSTAGIVEATFADRFFVGAGGGYGVLNNPSGLMLEARAGLYPFWRRIANSVRRKGLMVGVNAKTIFIDGATGILILGSLGYEKF